MQIQSEWHLLTSSLAQSAERENGQQIVAQPKIGPLTCVSFAKPTDRSWVVKGKEGLLPLVRSTGTFPVVAGDEEFLHCGSLLAHDLAHAQHGGFLTTEEAVAIEEMKDAGAFCHEAER
jgi:hypothetical protein